MKNYYEILEVNEKASQETINKVFKMHIKKWHPDLYQGEEKIIAENKTKEINEAYAVLSNPQKRASYDVELSNSTFNESKNFEIEMLKEEIETLKKNIEKKDLIINNLTNPYSETSKNRFYSNYYEDYEQNDIKYTKENQLKSIFEYLSSDANKTNIKIIITVLILFIGSIMIFLLLINLPIFRMLYY